MLQRAESGRKIPQKSSNRKRASPCDSIPGTRFCSEISISHEAIVAMRVCHPTKSIAANGDGTRVYALRRGNPNSSILVINTSTDAVVQTISIPVINAQGIAVTQDPNSAEGQFAYVVGTAKMVAVDLNAGSQVGSTASFSFVANLIVLSADGNSAHVFHFGYSAAANADAE